MRPRTLLGFLGVLSATIAGAGAASAGCSSSNAHGELRFDDGYGGGTSPGGGLDAGRRDVGGPVDPRSCSKVTCDPPTCCGQSCAGGCCKGTVCGKSGTCIPASCSDCGTLGCDVDFSTCTAKCSKPTCCSSSCSTDADCCAGTTCSTTTKGTRICFPTSCKSCGGMTSTCSLGSDCVTTCIPPDSCGKACTSDGDCGTGSLCNTFLDGARECVPAAFKEECSACGSGGCLFYPAKCTVECKSDVPDATPVDTGAPPPYDSGFFYDTGSTSFDSSRPDAPTVDTAPSCAACCAPCGPTTPCCSGSTCGKDKTGASICVPSTCSSCDYGCTFSCPVP